MKTILVASVALATLFASPVLAQTTNRQARQVITNPFAQIPTVSGAVVRRGHSSNPANDVYDTQGFYAGSDPDQHIRSDLVRDPPDRSGD